jgi:hypothetical protein
MAGVCCGGCSFLGLLGFLFYIVLALLAHYGNEPFLVVKANGRERKEETE